MYRGARWLMERKLGAANPVSVNLDARDTLSDGRARYRAGLRTCMYSALIRAAREARPNLELALCLEDPGLWRAVGLERSIGKCNCVL